MLVSHAAVVIVALSEHLLSHLQHLRVLQCKLCVTRRRVYQFEAAQVRCFVLMANLGEFFTKTFLQVWWQSQELARFGSVFNEGLHVALVDLLALFRETQHLNGVSDQVAFYFLVQGRISGETRTMVDFKQIRLALMI